MHSHQARRSLGAWLRLDRSMQLHAPSLYWNSNLRREFDRAIAMQNDELYQHQELWQLQDKPKYKARSNLYKPFCLYTESASSIEPHTIFSLRKPAESLSFLVRGSDALKSLRLMHGHRGHSWPDCDASRQFR